MKSNDFLKVNKVYRRKISKEIWPMAKKVSKPHVPPICDKNVCDSTNGKEKCVKFAIAISAVRDRTCN